MSKSKALQGSKLSNKPIPETLVKADGTIEVPIDPNLPLKVRRIFERSLTGAALTQALKHCSPFHKSAYDAEMKRRKDEIKKARKAKAPTTEPRLVKKANTQPELDRKSKNAAAARKRYAEIKEMCEALGIPASHYTKGKLEAKRLIRETYAELLEEETRSESQTPIEETWDNLADQEQAEAGQPTPEPEKESQKSSDEIPAPCVSKNVPLDPEEPSMNEIALFLAKWVCEINGNGDKATPWMKPERDGGITVRVEGDDPAPVTIFPAHIAAFREDLKKLAKGEPIVE